MCSPARFAISVFACAVVAACGSVGNESLPAAVTAGLASLTEQCTAVEGIPHAEDAVQRADLDADGDDDFVVYAGWIFCENAASIYGDREKPVMVYAGDGRGAAAEAFNNLAFDAQIERDGGARLWLTTWAGGCGRPRAATFAEETFCNRAIEWNAAAQRFDYAPVATIRLIQ